MLMSFRGIETSKFETIIKVQTTWVKEPVKTFEGFVGRMRPERVNNWRNSRTHRWC
jgi:hypothetical protein